MTEGELFDDSGLTGDHDLEEALYLERFSGKNLYKEYKSKYRRTMKRKGMTPENANAITVCAILAKNNNNLLYYLQRKGIIQLPS